MKPIKVQCRSLSIVSVPFAGNHQNVQFDVPPGNPQFPIDASVSIESLPEGMNRFVIGGMYQLRLVPDGEDDDFPAELEEYRLALIVAKDHGLSSPELLSEFVLRMCDLGNKEVAKAARADEAYRRRGWVDAAQAMTLRNAAKSQSVMFKRQRDVMKKLDHDYKQLELLYSAVKKDRDRFEARVRALETPSVSTALTKPSPHCVHTDGCGCRPSFLEEGMLIPVRTSNFGQDTATHDAPVLVDPAANLERARKIVQSMPGAPKSGTLVDAMVDQVAGELQHEATAEERAKAAVEGRRICLCRLGRPVAGCAGDPCQGPFCNGQGIKHRSSLDGDCALCVSRRNNT